MKANRAAGTSPERRFRAALAVARIRGYRLNLKGVLGRPDVAFPTLKIAVFIHGCFWHHSPGILEA
jgi:DNA mismatch endonuclease (patch repair protein)